MSSLVTATEGIRAIAIVHCASVPEVAIVENCIHYAGRVARRSPASIDSFCRVVRVRIRENRIDNGCGLLNAGGIARVCTNHRVVAIAVSVAIVSFPFLSLRCGTT